MARVRVCLCGCFNSYECLGDH